MCVISLFSELYLLDEYNVDKENIRYETIDYYNEIYNAIDDLDFTLSMINSILDDINRLKEKYNNEFARYGVFI